MKVDIRILPPFLVRSCPILGCVRGGDAIFFHPGTSWICAWILGPTSFCLVVPFVRWFSIPFLSMTGFRFVANRLFGPFGSSVRWLSFEIPSSGQPELGAVSNKQFEHFAVLTLFLTSIEPKDKLEASCERNVSLVFDFLLCTSQPVHLVFRASIWITDHSVSRIFCTAK